MHHIFKCTPVTDVFLDHFWAFAPEPQRLHQYKQLPGIYKHQITVTEKSTFIVHTGPCLCLALGLWSAPLRLLRRSLRVPHTKHPLEETLCLIYGFECLFWLLFLLADLIMKTLSIICWNLCGFAVWFCGAAGRQPADRQRAPDAQRTGSSRPHPPGRVHPVPGLGGVAPGVL